MRSNKWMLIGAAAVAAGVLMLGMAYGTSGVVHAGGQQIPCDATAIPTATPDGALQGEIQAFQAAPAECTATATTQRKLKTHTPTATPTEQLKTATPAPTNTPEPTNTPKAASEAVLVKPPNTGSGNGASGDNMTLWLLGLGGIAVALGGGALAVGVRRR